MLALLFKELPKMRGHLLFMSGIIALHIAAEKCRQLVGEEALSKSATERFTFLNCFDMSYGTMACLAKECIKLYLYYIRALHVHNVRREATKVGLDKHLSEGKSLEEAVKSAYREGDSAASRASRQAKHVLGPAISSGWDLFETIYVGGTLVEGTIRGIGTFWGAYIGGVIGEGGVGWVGFLVGSQIGSWVGGRIGLMGYDVAMGVQYLLQFFHTERANSLSLANIKDHSL